MYLSFFGLNEKPFAITPDPRYLFLSERHAEALAHLVYGINEAGGFVQLTGEVGTGKTTIIRSLLAQAPRNAEVALILNPRITAPEFLLTICEELGIGVPDAAVGSVKDLVDILNRYLLRAHSEGRRVVLVVDEAQNLAPEVLEQVRLLTNLETETHKLLQIILIGQPELRELLARTELRQLAQRITGRYHLDPLSREESAAYVQHRLRVAGATSDIFTLSALRETHRLSDGVPRLINIIADRALLGAYTQDRHKVSTPLVLRAAGEVFGRRIAPAWLPWAIGAGSLLAVALVGTLAWRSYQQRDSASGMTVITAATHAATTTRAAASNSANAAGAGTAVAAVGAAAAPAAMLDNWLSTIDPAAAKNASYASLFAQWHLPFAVQGGDPCVQAQNGGLSCLAQRGSLAQIALYNRPAMLTLIDARGISRELALVRLAGDKATLMSGSSVHELPVAELTRYWFGDYTLLWQPGALGAHTLAFGARGANVKQLRSALRRLAQLPPAAGATVSYDSELMQLVENFQRRSRLTVDGVAGVQTLVALDAALAAPGTPLLNGAAAAATAN